MLADDEKRQFFDALVREDKKTCVEWSMQQLASGRLDISALYTGVLGPGLNIHGSCGNDEFPCIWKEHVRTGIIRTIIEASYPYVIKEQVKTGLDNHDKTVLVLCPPKETHEIGARMVADFFTIYGYNTIFVGSDTPAKSFLSAIEKMAPRYVAISTSNPYNVFHLQKTIEQIRDAGKDKGLKIIVGGRAFKDHPDLFKTIGADMQIDVHGIAELAQKDAASISR